VNLTPDQQVAHHFGLPTSPWFSEVPVLEAGDLPARALIDFLINKRVVSVQASSKPATLPASNNLCSP